MERKRIPVRMWRLTDDTISVAGMPRGERKEQDRNLVFLK